MKQTQRIVLGALAVAFAAAVSAAQIGGGGFSAGGAARGGRGGRGFGGGGFDQHVQVDLTDVTKRNGVAIWQNQTPFKSDLFTFVRLQYSTRPGLPAYQSTRWLSDYPDSDLNFSFRLAQMTSLKVDPVPKQIKITDPQMFNYPFVYMLEIAVMQFTDPEIAAMRRYLLNGGFLMIDDHWGLAEQQNFIDQIKRVFPDRPLTELDISHPIFHCLFDIKQLPQVPGHPNWERWQTTGEPDRTWERTDDEKPHYRSMFDDNGRMMLIECGNTDFGDGWEREGSDEEYFHKFSENQAFPMGMNIVFWAMTH